MVDDDPDVRASLERALRYAGYTVTTAVHGADALDYLARSPVDLIVLDVLMPMLDGFDACRRLRQRGVATPVLVLTARDAIEDRVTGLEAGADDYLVKPFALRELHARIRALLRRSQVRHEVLGYADLTLDLTTRSVTRDKRLIPLTRTEFDLLELLLRNADRAGYDLIQNEVWEPGEAPRPTSFRSSWASCTASSSRASSPAGAQRARRRLRPADGRMTLRSRFTLAVAGAVAAVALAVTAVAFLVVRADLTGQVKHELRQQAAAVEELARHYHGHLPAGWVPPDSGRFGASAAYAQVVTAAGTVRAPAGDTGMLPETTAAAQVAGGQHSAYYTEATMDGVHAMVLTTPLAPGLAVQLAVPLNVVDTEVGSIGATLALLSAAGIGLAALAGWAVARAGLAPVGHLAAVAEQVTATGDPSQRVEVDRADELGRLAASFNTMLGALQRSLAAQRQLVSDASHELRTPLTSLSINAELLAAEPGMPEAERREVLDRVVAQAAELGQLVAGVTELARGDTPSAMDMAGTDTPGTVMAGTNTAGTGLGGTGTGRDGCGRDGCGRDGYGRAGSTGQRAGRGEPRAGGLCRGGRGGAERGPAGLAAGRLHRPPGAVPGVGGSRTAEDRCPQRAG